MTDHPSPAVYFAGAIRAGRALQPTYAALVAHLIDMGCVVLSEEVGSATLDEEERGLTDAQIYVHDLERLAMADAVVAEVTVPSLGVGYEISYMLHHRERPVLCLCREGTSLSAMLTGNPHPGLRLVFYPDLDHALAAIDHFLARLPAE